MIEPSFALELERSGVESRETALGIASVTQPNPHLVTFQGAIREVPGDKMGPSENPGDVCMKRFAIPLALAAGIGCTSVFAQEWYFGIGAGRASLGGRTTLETTTQLPAGTAGSATSYSFSPTQFGGHDTALTARYGWRFHRNLALELGYYDLGKYSFDIPVADTGGVRTVTGSATARSYGLSLVGILPLERFDLYGRIGYARTEVKSSADSGATSSRGRIRENEAFGALGARWNITPTIGLFAEYQKHDKLDLNGSFAGLDYRF
jgi:hypothetical protein